MISQLVMNATQNEKYKPMSAFKQCKFANIIQQSWVPESYVYTPE